LPQTIFEIDRGGTIISANSVALKTFGYEKDDLKKGINVLSVFNTGDHNRLKENIRRILQGERLGGTGYTAQRKDGTLFPVIVFSNVILDKNVPVGLRGVLIDVTELKKTEEALERANKKLQLLNSITRHDILNQITVLNIHHSLIEEMVDNRETLSFLQNAKKAADTISRQISFTQEYHDIGVKTPVWQNVHTHFMNAASSFTTTSVIIEPCEKNIEIYADPLLEKVFYNLIDNSLRYGEKLTKIRVTHRVDEEGLTLVYEDDGIGIPLEEKQKIFHKGFGKNTGLGLFLAREILAITGITITENGEPFKGVRFEILVPKGMYRLTGTPKPLS
jgi:PAS domain S-box-containing protein